MTLCRPTKIGGSQKKHEINGATLKENRLALKRSYCDLASTSMKYVLNKVMRNPKKVFNIKGERKARSHSTNVNSKRPGGTLRSKKPQQHMMG